MCARVASLLLVITSSNRGLLAAAPSSLLQNTYRRSQVASKACLWIWGAMHDGGNLTIRPLPGLHVHTHAKKKKENKRSRSSTLELARVTTLTTMEHHVDKAAAALLCMQVSTGLQALQSKNTVSICL
jgi:hypothetical protein